MSAPEDVVIKPEAGQAGVSGSWKIAAASVTGFSHLEKNEPCQDAHAWKVEGRWLVAVVADGAGSASFSHLGAQRICEHLCSRLAAEFTPVSPCAPNRPLWERRIVQSITEVREKLRHDLQEGQSLSDFHATLVGFVGSPEGGLVFHIGDGSAALIQDEQWHPCLMSQPENGEWANETFFFTQVHWLDHLRFLDVPEPVSRVILASDGSAAFAVAKDRKGLDDKFIAPVDRHLLAMDEETAAKALSQTLNHPATRQITGDDKTLLWAAWVAQPEV